MRDMNELRAHKWKNTWYRILDFYGTVLYPRGRRLQNCMSVTVAAPPRLEAPKRMSIASLLEVPLYFESQARVWSWYACTSEGLLKLPVLSTTVTVCQNEWEHKVVPKLLV
jgi:hypothetical protein